MCFLYEATTFPLYLLHYFYLTRAFFLTCRFEFSFRGTGRLHCNLLSISQRVTIECNTRRTSVVSSFREKDTLLCPCLRLRHKLDTALPSAEICQLTPRPHARTSFILFATKSTYHTQKTEAPVVALMTRDPGLPLAQWEEKQPCCYTIN